MNVKLLIDYKGNPYLKLTRDVGHSDEIEDNVMENFMRGARDRGISYEQSTPYTNYIKLNKEEKDE